MASNPWMVENIEAFVYYCCPECVFRSKDESFFQSHALQNHAGSNLLFNRQTYNEDTKIETYATSGEISTPFFGETFDIDKFVLDETFRIVIYNPYNDQAYATMNLSLKFNYGAVCKFLVQCVTLTSYFPNWTFQFS